MRINPVFTRIALLLISFFSVSSSFSQSNFIAGTIITANGDSIHGLIDYRNWEKNPHKVSFKKTVDGKAKSYDALEIMEFMVADEIYIGAIVESEITLLKTNELKYNPELELEMDTVFLQTMIRGTKSLFHCKNAVGNDLFYIKNNNGFEMLKYKKFLIIQGNKEYEEENKTFLNQLQVYLQDCFSIQPQLERTKYKKNDLQTLFEYYFKCKKTNVEFEKKNEKLKVNIGVLGGISSASLAFSGLGFDYLTKSSFPKSYDPAGGIFIDLGLPRNLQRWSLINELLFNTYTTKGHYHNQVHADNYTDTYTKFSFAYLRYNLMIRYRHSFNKFSVFGNIGLSNGYAIRATNHLMKVSKFYTTETVREGEALPDARKHEQGLIFGIGATNKRFSMEARYEAANAMSDYPSLHSSVDRLYFLLGYRL